MTTHDFSELLRDMGTQHYRSMPWREDTRPYFILVSELMLQQTQVARVIPKFEAFIKRFPDERTLAAASLNDVLTYWQGLGYNRRAKFLHDAAKMIVARYDGVFPNGTAELIELPGVGKNTAGAIQTYAFNQPSFFIETNVRTVYIHHFFHDTFDVSDESILRLLRETIDKQAPRDFYWALMDYSSYLKASGVRNIDQSAHYKKQPRLEGSVRQMRGRIIRSLTSGEKSDTALRTDVKADQRYEQAIAGLTRDGLIESNGHVIHLTK